MSHVTFFFLFFFSDKVVKLFGGGLLSTGHTPSSFKVLLFKLCKKAGFWEIGVNSSPINKKKKIKKIFKYF